MEKLPKISLVMSSFSRVGLLQYGLRSIIKHKPDFPIEVVVVNDGLENDKTKEVCDLFGMALNIKYIFTGQRNYKGIIKRCPSIPNNVAIRQATGDIVILTCPEIMHLNNAIPFIVQPLLEDKKRLTIPSFMFFDDRGTYTQLLSRQPNVDVRFLEKHEGHVQMPFFMGVWKKEIMDIGGYDEDFTEGYASEDNDFVERLISNGCEYYRTPALVVHLFHGLHCTGQAQLENPLWVRNKKLWDDRKDQIVRNVGKEWGSIKEPIIVVEQPVIVEPITVVEKPVVKEIEKIKPSLEEVFTDIYKNRKWSSTESASGTGSELKATVNIRKQIPIVFKKYGIKRILDIGCGDVNWMKTLFYDFEFYLGIDVVKVVINRNRKLYGSDKILFKQAIITNSEFSFYKELNSYDFDVVILNDVLVHLSFEDIKIVLEKLKQSTVKYILTTTFLDYENNRDIPSGRWRPLNLMREPFDFPRPLEVIDNTDELVVNDPADVKKKTGAGKSLALWGLQDPMALAKTPTINGIPKIAHLYWDGSPISWLQVQTLTTFHKQNPDWEIRLYIPVAPYIVPHGKYVPDYTGKDNFDLIKELSYVKIIKVDVTKYGIDDKIHNILQSDIFRYKMLYEIGGVWMDFDVLWLKPISEIFNIRVQGMVGTKEMGAFVCRYESEDITFHNIGILMSKPKHPLYKAIIDECMRIQERNKDREALLHQNFGTNVFDALYPTFEDVCRQFSDVVNIPYKVFYPYSIFDLEKLYNKDKPSVDEKSALCVHWFNGHKLSKNFINTKFKPNSNNNMTRIISLIKREKL
jgi:SAM-dependent methyltransferase